MAKVQQKSEKISAFGGIFFVLDRFDRILSSVIDSHLGLRSKLIGYQYSEIIRAIFSVFCCGSKLLPIHRGIAAYGCPFWNQGHRQSQEFSVQIHRRPCQVDHNGTTIQTQHLLQQTIQHNLGARID